MFELSGEREQNDASPKVRCTLLNKHSQSQGEGGRNLELLVARSVEPLVAIDDPTDKHSQALTDNGGQHPPVCEANISPTRHAPRFRRGRL